MKPLIVAVLICLALLAPQGSALAEEPLLHGSASALSTHGLTNSQVAAWLTFRYDAHKEAGVSLPGQKEFQAWLVTGRCRWIEGMNVAAGYEVWSPSPDLKNQIHTTRGGVSYRLDGLNPTYLQNKAAEFSVERSFFADPTREPSYGAVAAFTMQF